MGSEDEALPVAKTKDKWGWLKALARILLFVFGLSAVVYVVNEAGPEHVWNTLVAAGVFVPVILVLEALFMSMDVLSLRALIGAPAKNVPALVWFRSGLTAYAIMILLPGGRAAGEVARAAQLGPYLGGGAKAAAYATRLQAVTLLGNTTISIPCAIACFIAAGASEALPWFVLGNGIGTGILGGIVVFAARKSSLGAWIGQRFPSFGQHGASFDEALRHQTPWAPPIFFSFLGRAIQAAQYGMLLLAVGGSLTFLSALVSQGIHLVGAGLGDMIPNQVGITEGAYRLFAPALGLGDDPARAIGIALLARFCQFALAAIGLAIGALSPASKDAQSAA